MYKIENEMQTKKVCYTGLHDTILWDMITRYQAAQEAIASSQTLITYKYVEAYTSSTRYYRIYSRISYHEISYIYMSTFTCSNLISMHFLFVYQSELYDIIVF